MSKLKDVFVSHEVEYETRMPEEKLSTCILGGRSWTSLLGSRSAVKEASAFMIRGLRPACEN